MDRNRYTDWREPLYEYANEQLKQGTVLSLKEARNTFLFLGGYLDSEELSGRCAEKLRQLQDAPAADIGRVNGKPPDRKRTAQGRLYTLKTARAWLLAGIFAAVLAAAVFLGWQKQVLDQARMHEAGGAYAEALGCYWKLLAGPFYREASEKIPELQNAYADSLLAEQQFQQAVDIYTELEDTDGVKRAHNAWGEYFVEKENYSEAVGQFVQAENSRREQETYLSWSRAEAADGRIQEAIEILLQARPSHETSELLTDLRLQRCEEAVRSLRAAVPAEEEIKESEDGAPARHTVRDIKYAAEIGAELDDVDSILTYFRALAECGYEPGAVYPDGVEVIDVPTGSYQLPEDRKAAQADQNQTVPLEGKGLIFTREQIIPDDPKQYLSQTEHVIVERPWNPADDSLYRVKLQPAELYQLPEERRAESIAECSWIYLADTVYRVSGTAVMENEFRTKLNGRTMTMKNNYYYPFLGAVSSGAFYASGNPEQCEVAGCQMTVPELQKQLTGKDAVSMPVIPVPYDPLKLSAEEMAEYFFGKPDPAFCRKMLKKGVDIIIEE
ncbi:MAG: hypothetical protein IJI10_02530 [Eubacterium sp.]|nr:hypothetical protein [Eubacterium sp.]